MIEKIAAALAIRMAEVLNENGKINIFSYGLQIVLNTIFSITLVLLLGSIVGKPLHTLFYLISYCVVRIWAGGYHASSNGKCMFLFIAFFILSIICAEIIVFNKGIIYIGLGIEIVLLFLVAPIGTVENPIPKPLIKSMKYKSVFSAMMVSFLIILLNNVEMKMYCFMGFSWVVVLVLCGKILKEESHEK